MDIDRIKAAIRERFPEYTDSMFEAISSDLEELTPVVRFSLEKFLNEGVLSDIEIMGYSLKAFVEEWELNEVAAHLNINFLIREPEKALESLRKGYDRIV